MDSDKRIGTVVGVIFGVLGLAALWLVPRLQSNRAIVGARTSEHVERARRMLDQYNAGLEQMGAINRSLAGDQAEVVLTSERVSSVLDQNPDLVAEAEAQFKQLTAAWPKKPAPLAGASAVTRAAQSGLKDQAAEVAAHTKLLDQALAELQQGLTFSKGDVNGDSILAAKMLETAILYQQGAAAQREAVLLRGRAESPRVNLLEAAHRLATLAKSEGLLSANNIDAQIKAAHELASGLKQRIDAHTTEIAGLDGQIAHLKAQIAERRAQAEEARARREQMEETGVDLTRPGSFQDFSAKFGELAATYSRSLAEAAALEAGTLKNAEIDDSGDYVSGSYVPVGAGQIGTERGLAGLQRDRAVAEAELDRLKEALVSAEADIKTSEELRRHLDATVARDRERAQRIKDSVGPLLDELKKTVAEAETVESKAVQKLNGAIKASAAAMNIANDAVNQARQSVSELSPKAQAAAAESLAQNDSWVAAQRGAQKADAQILLGKVYYQQFRDAARDQKLLSEIGAPLRLSDVDAGAYAQKRDTAKRLGTEVLEDAIKQLENSWRALKEHWTVRAEIAGATHLLSLFGDPDGVLRDTALANYQSAVEGREDNPHAAAYVERIRQLRR